MKKSIFMVGVAALFVAGCKPTLLTTAQREQYEEDFGTITKIQLFLDREIEIERVTTEKQTSLDGGEVVTRKGVNYLTIYFPEGLEGRALSESDNDERIYTLLDDSNPKAFLTFKNYKDDNFYHLAGKNKDGEFYVTYAGYDDFKVTIGSEARLMKKVSEKTKVKKKRMRAKGARVK